MKFGDFYRTAVEIGIENDPRGKAFLKEELARVNKKYKDMGKKKQKRFDEERLTNPYADTRMLCGDPETEIKKILVGIDMEVGEIVLADRLNEKGAGIDLVMAHHPEGKALAGLYQVMAMQSEIIHRFGVPINFAEAVMGERIKDVERRLLPTNHNRSVGAASLLGLNYMCCHTPTDNMVTTWLQAKMDKIAPRTLDDVMDILLDIEEYQQSDKIGAGPKIFVGSPDRRAGKIFVDFTGGTGGSKKIFEKLSNTDVGTVVGMHMSDENRKEAEKHHINVVIAGHISSDNLGINLMFDQIEKKHSDLEIVATSGFNRVSRN